jgi:hypothetical protein
MPGRLFSGVLAAAVLALPQGVAAADGLPVVGVNTGPEGVASAGSRFVALPAGKGTLVARLDTNGARVLRSVFLREALAVPGVAFDGTTAGLSADERTLVLIRPRRGFPQRTTRLLVLDADHLRARSHVTLRGDFSFDALSPDGAWLYLIQYTSRRDPTHYAVRAYDVRAGRLASEPVVDPRERDEAMRGSPVTRASSPDGRWAYTLYDGGGGTPFVHALDTVRRTAACVDLPALAGRDDLLGLRLALGRRLVVLDGSTMLASIEPGTWKVTVPVARAHTPATPRESERSSLPWELLLVGSMATLGAGAGAAAVRRRRVRAARA